MANCKQFFLDLKLKNLTIKNLSLNKSNTTNFPNSINFSFGLQFILKQKPHYKLTKFSLIIYHVFIKDTLEQLESIRHRTTANAQMLTATINALLERLKNVWDNVEPHYVKLQDWSNIYWTSGWVAGMVIVWILLFLIMSYSCYLCDANIKAGVILFVAVVIICLSSICITLYGVLSLAIGGNAEIFLCQPMYDSDWNDGSPSSGITSIISTDIKWKITNKDNNAYDVLGKLFDKPGYVYKHEPQTGIIGELLRPDGVNHSIVNVSLATALRYV